MHVCVCVCVCACVCACVCVRVAYLYTSAILHYSSWGHCDDHIPPLLAPHHTPDAVTSTLCNEASAFPACNILKCTPLGTHHLHTPPVTPNSSQSLRSLTTSPTTSIDPHTVHKTTLQTYIHKGSNGSKIVDRKKLIYHMLRSLQACIVPHHHIRNVTIVHTFKFLFTKFLIFIP